MRVPRHLSKGPLIIFVTKPSVIRILREFSDPCVFNYKELGCRPGKTNIVDKRENKIILVRSQLISDGGILNINSAKAAAGGAGA